MILLKKVKKSLVKSLDFYSTMYNNYVRLTFYYLNIIQMIKNILIVREKTFTFDFTDLDIYEIQQELRVILSILWYWWNIDKILNPNLELKIE